MRPEQMSTAELRAALARLARERAVCGEKRRAIIGTVMDAVLDEVNLRTQDIKASLGARHG